MEPSGGSTPPESQKFTVRDQAMTVDEVVHFLLSHRDDSDLQRRVLEVFGEQLVHFSSQTSLPGLPMALETSDGEQSHHVTLLVPETRQTPRIERVPSVSLETAEVALKEGCEPLFRKIRSLVPANRTAFTIHFEGLTYTPEVVPDQEAQIPSVGSKLQSLLCFLLCRRPERVPREVLHGLTGTLWPHTSTLLLGAPRSGKSSLMKVLCGRAQEGRHVRVTGTVTYNGVPRERVLLTKVCGYISQRDEHYPSLTVRETVRFARDCMICLAREVEHTPPEQHNPELVDQLRRIHNINDELMLKILGISHVGDTVVGSEMLRGISGGQKRRLTSGEVLVAKQRVVFADEITTGLDSATAFEVCKALTAECRLMGRTLMISLLQPSPEVFGLFDHVMLLCKGHIIYYGPVNNAVPYFDALGYRRPREMEPPDFLQLITTDSRVQFVSSEAREAPKTPELLAAAYRSSDVFRQMSAVPPMESTEMKLLPKNYLERRLVQKFPYPYVHYLKVVLIRQARLLVRNRSYIVARLVQVTATGLLAGTLFFNLDKQQYQTHYGLMFNAVLSVSLSNSAAIPSMVNARKVLYKQLDSAFFPPSVYALANILVQIPM
eukprot:RCo010896